MRLGADKPISPASTAPRFVLHHKGWSPCLSDRGPRICCGLSVLAVLARCSASASRSRCIMRSWMLFVSGVTVAVLAVAGDVAAQSPASVRVVSRAQILSRPGADANVVSSVDPGTILQVLDSYEQWNWVVLPAGPDGCRSRGWVRARCPRPRFPHSALSRGSSGCKGTTGEGAAATRARGSTDRKSTTRAGPTAGRIRRGDAVAAGECRAPCGNTGTCVVC
jgi:hypothetical protein